MSARLAALAESAMRTPPSQNSVAQAAAQFGELGELVSVESRADPARDRVGVTHGHPLEEFIALGPQRHDRAARVGRI